MTTRVAIYARCSDTKQAEKELSIPAQLDACRAEAARQGWAVVREFVDEGISGRTDHRPAFQDMIAAAKETPRAFDVILLWKLSRFARNREHATFYKNLLRKRGVTVTSLHERVDDTAQGRLMEGFIEVMDEYYSENLAQDTKRGMIRKVKQGQWVGGSIPYGYRVERPEGRPREARMVLNEAEAPLVRRIFADAARGVGAATIARVLNREGVTTRKGRKWTNDVVLYLLRNRAYLGELRWGKADDGTGAPAVLLPNAHEPLVDAETFERIEGLIAERVVEKVSPRRLGSDYLLSGLLRCGYCGLAMIGHGAKSGKVHYYGCPTKMKSGADQCAAVLLNREALEGAVIEHLSNHVLQVANLRSLLDEVNEGLDGTTSVLATERDAKRAQLGTQRQQLNRLIDALALGTIDPAAIADRINDLKRTTDVLTAEVASLEARLAEAAPVVLTDDELHAYVEGLRSVLTTRPLDEQRAFLGAWVRSIVATGKSIAIDYTVPGYTGSEDGGAPDLDSSRSGRSTRRRGERAAAGVNQIRRVLSTAGNGAPCWA
ncbi:MAG TPA: recombinase family protein [Myxococcota bacterium]|nr:recombinase family protein [Myxococcota bacterium]